MPPLCIYIYCIDYFFPPVGVTQANDHVTSHPWGLANCNNNGCKNNAQNHEHEHFQTILTINIITN